MLYERIMFRNFIRDLLSNKNGDGVRGCLHGEGPALPRGLDFNSRLHGEKLALLPGLTTFIFRRNPESDICVQVFIL